MAPVMLCVGLCRYKRDDGIDMTATLYLPPGYDREKDGALPCLIWAYPREFKSKDAAGQSSSLCLLLGSITVCQVMSPVCNSGAAALMAAACAYLFKHSTVAASGRLLVTVQHASIMHVSRSKA